MSKFFTVLIVLFCNFRNSFATSPVHPDVLAQIKPWLLPHDHHLHASMDKIFTKGRATENGKSLKKAGFSTFKHAWSNVVVAKHKKLSGYVVKIYTDDVLGVDDAGLLLRRVHGAELIRNIIKGNGFEWLCKVPRKWLYPLPDSPENGNLERKHFVLVAEDMNLLSDSDNKDHWKSSKITHKILDTVLSIMQQGGLNDCIYVHNMPFSTDGKIAFIDTEHFYNGPIYYHILTPSFSKSNRIYWQKITGG